MTDRQRLQQADRQAAGGGRRFVYQCALRWSDLDAFHHVNNARVLTLYEEARIALLFLHAERSGVSSFSQGVVIARHEVDYLRPIGYVPGDPPDRAPSVRIEMWVEELRSSRFTIAYELYDGDALAGRARSVLVPYDLVGKRSRRMTEAERAFLEAYLLPGGAGETADLAGQPRGNPSPTDADAAGAARP
ncbi:MAG: thioesterase [Actinobacteria bacterium]|nr:MAG: thioesterase [Actinomycetota bacterium]